MGDSEKSAVRSCSVYEPDFVLEGLYFDNGKNNFNRLPEGTFISGRVHDLSVNTAGVLLRFKTDSSSIGVRAKITVTMDTNADHMAQTASKGFDLYYGVPGSSVFAGVSRFEAGATQYTSTLLTLPDPEKEMHEYTLHFPLYAGVESFELLLDAEARIGKPSPRKDPRPVVVYGTSIQQGGCASRPGMCHTNIMSRTLNRPFLNFGFSGGGNGESQMAQILASIENPALYVLDYDANAGVEGLKNTLTPFMDILRSAHRDTPVLLVSKTPYGREFLPGEAAKAERTALTAIHQQELAERRKQGDRNIYFLDGSTLYGENPSECTVDGAHATDLGFYRIAERMGKVIEEILTERA